MSQSNGAKYQTIKPWRPLATHKVGVEKHHVEALVSSGERAHMYFILKKYSENPRLRYFKFAAIPCKLLHNCLSTTAIMARSLASVRAVSGRHAYTPAVCITFHVQRSRCRDCPAVETY